MDMALIFKALSDQSRLAIVSLVAKNKEICACELLKELAITQTTLSHHMKVLVQAKIIQETKRGRWKHYTLASDTINDCLSFFNHLLKQGGNK